MFFYDCHVTFDQDTLSFDSCSFKFIAYQTNPPLTLTVSPDVLIEIINSIDEETQLREIRKIYALPVPIKSDTKQEKEKYQLNSHVE